MTGVVRREVLLSAVMHRDYSTPSGYVDVAVFDDRIEVPSIGALPRGVAVEEITGAAVVKFRVPVAAAGAPPPASQPESASLALLMLLSPEGGALGKAGISAALGQREISWPVDRTWSRVSGDGDAVAMMSGMS